MTQEGMCTLVYFVRRLLQVASTKHSIYYVRLNTYVILYKYQIRIPQSTKSEEQRHVIGVHLQFARYDDGEA